MSVERDARTLAAEMLAIKTVMAHVLGRIDQLDPVLAEAVQAGFEDAADQIRKTAAKSRTKVTSEQAIRALAVVEALRAATFRKMGDRIRPSVANDNK
jgi:galactokinase